MRVPFLILVFTSLLIGCKEVPKPPVEEKKAEIKQEQSTGDRPIDDPNLTMFKKALIAAGLQDIFIGTGPFTVFAPTNDAFKKLGDDKVNELFKKEKMDQLVSILIFHFVPGKYLSTMLKTKSYATINGKSIDVTVTDGVIRVNNAKVIKPDLVGANGVVHQIDTVLIP